MREFMSVTKALADPNRVRILLALRRGELCVCQITELFGFAPSTISKHLSILHHAGLILSRKTERWVYYRLPGKSAPVAVREALDLGAKITRQIAGGRRRCKEIEEDFENRSRRNLPTAVPLMTKEEAHEQPGQPPAQTPRVF